MVQSPQIWCRSVTLPVLCRESLLWARSPDENLPCSDSRLRQSLPITLAKRTPLKRVWCVWLSYNGLVTNSLWQLYLEQPRWESRRAKVTLGFSLTTIFFWLLYWPQTWYKQCFCNCWVEFSHWFLLSTQRKHGIWAHREDLHNDNR